MKLHFQQPWISFPVKFWQVLHPPEKRTIAIGMKLSDHTFSFFFYNMWQNHQCQNKFCYTKPRWCKIYTYGVKSISSYTNNTMWLSNNSFIIHDICQCLLDLSFMICTSIYCYRSTKNTLMTDFFLPFIPSFVCIYVRIFLLVIWHAALEGIELAGKIEGKKKVQKSGKTLSPSWHRVNLLLQFIQKLCFLSATVLTCRPDAIPIQRNHSLYR